MQFIVEHQAKHEVEIQQIRETIRRNEAAFNRRMDRLERSQDRTDKNLQGAATMIGDLARENRAFARLQRRDHEDLKTLTKAVHSLVRRDRSPPEVAGQNS